MSKHFDIEDPAEVDKWTRYYYHIDDDERTDAYLVRNGFTKETSFGYIKRMNMALAWIEPQLTANTRPIFDEMKLLMSEYHARFHTTSPLGEFVAPEPETVQLESAKALNEKIEMLFNQAKTIHRLQPTLDAQEKYKQAQSERASKPRKLTERENERVAKHYWESKENGEGYGVVKALAAKYDVSETTIHNIVKKHKPKVN